MQDFLKEYRIPPDVSLKCAIWKKFFDEVVGRFPSALHHSYLSEFLKAISQKYVESNRAASFVFDLLLLGVNNLFSG